MAPPDAAGDAVSELSELDLLLGVKPKLAKVGFFDVGKTQRPLADSRSLRRTPTARSIKDRRHTDNASEAIRELPADGETVHYVISGDYNPFDLIDATMTLAEPAKCIELRMATLGFNGTNARRTLEMIAKGRVGRVTLIYSSWYEADPKEVETCAMLAPALPATGGWVIATRCHAKIMLLAFDDGRKMVWEGSGNLRNSRNIEQFTLTRDADLYNFHAEWMDDVYEYERAAKARSD